MARLILTDCFGVILDEIAPYWFQEHFHDPEKAKILKDKYFVPFDLGDLSFDEVMQLMAKELSFDPEELKEYWNGNIRIDEEVLAYYDSLREKGDIIALASNAGYPFLDDILDRHDLRKHFDHIFISCHFHIAKPDLAFYKYCLANTPGKFDEVYMVDDSWKNLAELSTIGIKAIHYHKISDIKSVLGE